MKNYLVIALTILPSFLLFSNPGSFNTSKIDALIDHIEKQELRYSNILENPKALALFDQQIRESEVTFECLLLYLKKRSNDIQLAISNTKKEEENWKNKLDSLKQHWQQVSPIPESQKKGFLEQIDFQGGTEYCKQSYPERLKAINQSIQYKNDAYKKCQTTISKLADPKEMIALRAQYEHSFPLYLKLEDDLSNARNELDRSNSFIGMFKCSYQILEAEITSNCPSSSTTQCKN